MLASCMTLTFTNHGLITSVTKQKQLTLKVYRDAWWLQYADTRCLEAPGRLNDRLTLHW